MFEPNAQLIFDRLSPSDRVIDLGGWACPFNRANAVIDSGPYDTRGFYATRGLRSSQGGDREWFTRETWIQRDLCDRKPFPFPDHSFDFAICSHTLEDLRDPVWVCQEMMRIARRGYIETPSRLFESTRGVEHHRIAGLSHHRWLVEMNAGRLVFLPKFHMIHSHWRFSLPLYYLKSTPREQHVSWMFWEDRFEVGERDLHGLDAIEAELEGFVNRTRPYSRPRLLWAKCQTRARHGVMRVWRGLWRRWHPKSPLA